MFCNKCGSELVPGAAFCLKCGQPVAPAPASGGEAAAPQTPQARHTVTFIRASQWYAVNPDVKIIIDDRDEYRIGNGQTLRIPMTPGTHSVVFKCGIRNKIIDLTVTQDLELHLKWNRLTGSLGVK